MPIQFITPSIISSVANTQVTGTITASQIATVNANTITSGSIPLAQVPQLTGAKMPTGSVLQVVSVSTTTKTTRQSTDWGDVTNLTASITPTSSSSKILVLVTVAGLQKPSGNTQEAPSLRLLRGATEIAAQINIMYSAGVIAYFQATTNFTYLDSPATTSSTTYKMQLRGRDASNGPVAVNTDNGGENSTITLLEIAA